MNEVLEPGTARPTDPDAEQVLNPFTKAGRHAQVAVSWQSKAITRDLGPHLTSLTYVDHLTNLADELSFDVEDRDGLWSGDWRPVFGDNVVARAFWDGWFGPTPIDSLRLGKFAHDKISISGPPKRASLQCVSAPLGTGLRRRKRTRAWRGVTLKRIAQDIADRAGLQLSFNGSEGGTYKSALQNNKSDLEFLQEECKEIGRTLKVTESSIAIFEEHYLDGIESTGDIDIIGGNVLSWSFDSDDSGRYGSCHITFFDPHTGKKLKGQFPADGQTVDGLDANGQTLELVISVSDKDEALIRAKALLRAENRFASRGKLTTVGDLGLVAGVTFNLTNAFGFDGKYIITRAAHHLLGGYTCDLEVRRCIEGY